MKCRWTITVPSGHRIKFTFEAFHLGSKGLDNCEKVDHVKVRDSYNENDPAYGTFCGNVAPAPIYSVGPKMEVTFVSDEERVFQGFSARFDAISGGKNSYSETSAHSILVRAWSLSGGDNFLLFARFSAIAMNTTLSLQLVSDSRDYDLLDLMRLGADSYPVVFTLRDAGGTGGRSVIARGALPCCARGMCDLFLSLF